MQQAIHNAENQQGKSVQRRRDIGAVPIADLTRDEIDRMRTALKIIYIWNRRELLDGYRASIRDTQELIAKALGIQEDAA
jgi:hypothetical protein